MATLNYLNTTHIDFGSRNMVADTMKQLGITRPMIVTDKGIVAAGILDNVREAMGNEFSPEIFDDTPENPTEEATLAALAKYKDAGCDGIISLGGGSSMDLAKGLALLATHEGDLTKFAAIEGGGALIGDVAPHIAMPTTAGTGSEVSVGSVIITKDGRKLIFASPNLLPKVALCDPDLTMGLPARLTAATGMDAVTHCIEAVISPMDNPPAEAVGLDGLRRAVQLGHLEKAVADGQDKDARYNMMMAASEGAMAFVKGLGAVHSMSHACGRIKELRLHHGTLNAVILPAVLRYNADFVGDKYDRIRDAMGLAAGADLAEAIEALNQRLGLPANLGEMGISMDTPGIVENATTDVCTFTNPRPLEAKDYETLFEMAIG
ncbi:iron-containing alcohol dehydrogenase [Pyruvatibacter mobilis]|uniref:Iron-containing alcohol dehydrogenase n=1 Tax=Pyruvatibacter mobilis TaxID=1712261 RepID=A0A845QBF0_9HYPH|nr:iron-containing alcohol dehydrogenase [Pyruvatibacter mobilis]NBG95526.1 iron-containing alcohol dehydrogenase [Pyruvatibacter mobilis]QJD75395.1 iron-containing alcohol dehydrogenase [Pyruvatibacter mobilis]GGD15201.1 iron-containing alcohol dehydrogenase [Pyruvatibacter mobilis]